MRVLVYVVLAESHLKKLSEVAGQLRDAGMNVEQEMPLLGAISGTADEDRIETLAAISGVASVSRARKVFTQ